MSADEVTREELAARLGDPALTILDVRGADEFAGEAGYPCDVRQGHLPSARHLDVRALAACVDLGEVRGLVGLPQGAEVVAYCHSGARSATAVGILRAAGYVARNYAGSWHEWSSDPSLPVE